MTPEAGQAIADAVTASIRDVLDRAVTLLERLSDRVDVLELELAYRREAPPEPPE
jgi:hypothetical protein